MIAATRRWFRRHRTPIAIGVGLVGAAYVASQYVLGKINDARDRMSSDRIAKENLRRRFEQNQEDCTYTVLELLPTATANIVEALNTEQITYEIQQMKGSGKSASSKSTTPSSLADTTMTEEDGKSTTSSLQGGAGVHAGQAGQATLPTQLAVPEDAGPKKTKRQLWGDLTTSSLTRAFTLIYTLSLLNLFTRIQLNLLGRRSYLSSVISLATASAASPGSNGGPICLENNDDNLSPEDAYGTDLDTNRKYLAFSWWLLNRGWVSLRARIQDAVAEVFSRLSPRENLTYEAFSRLALQARKKIEGETLEERRDASWLSILLPPRELEDEMLAEAGMLDPASPSSLSSKPKVRSLLDETSDLIESPVFTHVLTLLLDAGFAVLIENHLARGVFELPSPEDSTAESLQATRAVLLPKILSVLTKQAHVIGDGKMPNEYLVAMEQVPDLNAFSAVVYSANWQREIQAETVTSTATPSEVQVGAAAGSWSGGVSAAAAAGWGVLSEMSQPGMSREATAAAERLRGTEESAVFVDAESEFENAWAKASSAGS